MINISEQSVADAISRGDIQLAQVYATILQNRAMARLAEALEKRAVRVPIR